MNEPKKSFNKFILLWSGELISAIGSGLTSFGLGIYVFQRTGKVSAMALVTLLAFLPSLLLSAPAGILADRYDRRLLMIIGDSLSALGLVFILICMMENEAELWQICVGVTISSVFSSLLEPSYKASITDLLNEEEYTKASGLVSLASSAKYLISPILAGFLLSITSIESLLLIDIATFFVTVISIMAVRKGLGSKERKLEAPLIVEFKEGWRAISCNQGVLTLVIMTSIVTFSIGFLQTLFTPLLLAFTSTSILGITETICASGMLVSSILLGIISIKKGYVKMLTMSLFALGLFMMMFGLRENIGFICFSGCLIFSMLPFANTALDYLIRTNINNDVQGRAWGIVGVLSQLGYVVAYVTSGLLADYVFTPMLLSDGVLASTLGNLLGTGVGRGTGFLLMLAGFLLCITSLVLNQLKSVHRLENRGIV